MPRPLIVEVLANTKQFGAELDRAAGKTRQFGKAAGVVGLAVAGGLAYGLEKSVKSAMAFQSSMQLVTTQAGVSEKQLGQLKQGVLGLAGPTATAPDELAKGLYHLASQGLRGKSALDALKVAAEGAKVGQADLEDVTNALGATIASHIKGVRNLNQAMGMMNATVGAGDMRMQDLASAMGTGLPASARVAGVGLRDVNAALAVFGDNNIRGAKAGNLLQSALRVISSPSGAAARALGDVGINAMQLAQVMRTQGLPAALQWFTKQMKQAGLTATEQSALIGDAFGGRQSTGIKILIAEMDRFKRKEEEVGAGGSKFGDSWKKTTETAQFKMEQFRAAMDSVGVSLGTLLLPAVTKIAGALANFAQYLSQHTQLAKVLAVALGVLAAVLIGLASPIVAIVAGVSALGVALTIAWAKSEKFRNITLGAWQAISDWARANWPAIKQIIVAVFRDTWAVVKGVIDLFKAGWREFGGTIKTITRNDWNAIKGEIKGIVEVIRGVVNIIRGIAHGDWSQVWQGIKQVVGGAVGAIKALLSGLVRDAVAILGKLGSMAGNALKSAFAGIGAALAAVLKAPINAIISAIDALEIPTSMHIKTWHGVPTGVSVGWSHPFHIPQLAEGGIVNSPTLAMIGEAGPEAVVPLSNGTLGGNITINVGPVHGSADPGFARQLAAELATQIRGGRVPAFQQAVKAL